MKKILLLIVGMACLGVSGMVSRMDEAEIALWGGYEGMRANGFEFGIIEADVYVKRSFLFEKTTDYDLNTLPERCHVGFFRLNPINFTPATFSGIKYAIRIEEERAKNPGMYDLAIAFGSLKG